tara:strand:- start:1526 stop:1804 length:279 start_codon:yes stop_codon:yes gene_type:complete
MASSSPGPVWLSPKVSETPDEVLMSMFLTQLLLSLAWTVVGIVLVLGGTWLFDRLTPIDYRAEIRKGNVAAGVVLASVVLSITAVVVSNLVT